MKFAFLGPESTGKTTAANEIARRLNGVVVPEVARTYLADKGLNYNFDDILEIAKLQFKTEIELGDLNEDKIVVCDTELITIEVWLEYHGCEVPQWLTNYIHTMRYERYFLFDIDIPWIQDDLRAHGNDRIDILNRFRRKLNFYNKDWQFVSGQGEIRLGLIENEIRKKLDVSNS